jgi:hypothetical protein
LGLSITETITTQYSIRRKKTSRAYRISAGYKEDKDNQTDLGMFRVVFWDILIPDHP